MKKYSLLVFALLAMNLYIATPGAEAAEVSFGPVVWYSWWKPMFITAFKQLPYSVKSLNVQTKLKDSSFLYGLGLSVKFSDKWSLGGNFLFCAHSKMSYDASAKCYFISTFPIPTINPGMPFYLTYGTVDINHINKYDLDLIVNYAITNVVKFFFGAKSQVYNYKSRGTGTLYPGMIVTPGGRAFPAIIKVLEDSLEYNIGAGAGFSFTVHIVDNLFFFTSLSALAMAGEGLRKTKSTLSSSKNRGTLYSVGGNGTLSLAYYFEKAHMTVSLGGRYQVLRYGSLSHNTKIYDGTYDHFYGATLSVMFTF